MMDKNKQNKRVILPHERLHELWPESLRGKRIGVVVHPASVLPGTLEHVSTMLLAERELWHVGAFFGPQHGILGNTQDNMIVCRA